MTKPKYYELLYPNSPIKARVFKSYNDKTYELGYDCKWHCFQPMSMEALKAQTHNIISRAIYSIEENKVKGYMEKLQAYRVMRELADDTD